MHPRSLVGTEEPHGKDFREVVGHADQSPGGGVAWGGLNSLPLSYFVGPWSMKLQDLQGKKPAGPYNLFL